jgi:hypothetical protein
MIAMFDPYRRLVLYYNKLPEDLTMEEVKDYFTPLRLQIDTLEQLFATAQTEYAVTDFHPHATNKAWTNLALAIADVVQTSRRLF